MCKEGVMSQHPCFSLVQAILRLTEEDWQVEITHILRQGNNAADCFAKAGHNHDIGVVYYHSLPSSSSTDCFVDEKRFVPLQSGGHLAP